jgi:hypothetical protein
MQPVSSTVAAAPATIVKIERRVGAENGSEMERMRFLVAAG